MSKGRVPIPVRRMGTEVQADRRTRRARERGQAERQAIGNAMVGFICPDCGGSHIADGKYLGYEDEVYCLDCHQWIDPMKEEV